MIHFDPLADPCFTCGLWRNVTNPCIRPKTYKEGGIVIIGEYPAYQSGVASLGREWGSIEESFRAVTATEYTLLGAVRCRPTHQGSNRTPSKREVELCSAYLRDDLSLLQPNCIICLGAVAAKALHLPSRPLRELRNRRFWVVVDPEIALVEAPEGPRIDDLPKEAIPVWVTYSPAAYKRPGKSNLLHEMQQDIARYLGAICTRCGGVGGAYTCPKCKQPNRNPLRREGLPEDRTFTNPPNHDKLISTIYTPIGSIGTLETSIGSISTLSTPTGSITSINTPIGSTKNKAPKGPSSTSKNLVSTPIEPIGYIPYSNPAENSEGVEQTGVHVLNTLVLDIETTGFLKGYKVLPFDKGDILLLGYDQGEGYEVSETS